MKLEPMQERLTGPPYGGCPEYKVVSCRIRKAKKAHLRKPGGVVMKA